MKLLTILGLAGGLCTSAALAEETVWLSALDIGKTQQGWQHARADKSVDNRTLTIGGKQFERGVGTHADSALYVNLNGQGIRFSVQVGVDDEVGRSPGSVTFQVVGDGKVLAETGILKAGGAAKEITADLRGVKMLILLVTDGGDGMNFDHADWAEAKIVMASGKPVTVDAPREEAVILTPKASPKPRINSARAFGVRPGSPFLYTVAASGERPMTFAADNLPAGLALDPATGRITGVLKEKGTQMVTLRAKNAQGTDEKKLRIVCGDLIALTPPLGWNSWNCFAGAVSDAKVRAAADAMVASGLINHGWTYINIDDCWEAGRDAEGNIQSNKKFPDMKALAEYVHSKGLKIGLYSSPGPKTCAGFTGSYQHEEQDARRYAEWGFDYLKYDWCSYGDIAPRPNLEAMKKPYRIMSAAFAKAPRDMVFSLCQYGMGNVWAWGAEVNGNCWRTTGDITDTWGSMSGIGFAQDGHEKYAGPGHWNDPDMLVVGFVGWSANVRPTKLTPNEQYTHISLWCLQCSPLLIGCDMTRLDDFTLSLLTNDEVLEVNQDPLGKAAGRVLKEGKTEVWAKEMEDGSRVLGLFNRGEGEAEVKVPWASVGLSGSQKVRDLWRQADLGKFDQAFTAKAGRHGVVLIRVWPAQ